MLVGGIMLFAWIKVSMIRRRWPIVTQPKVWGSGWVRLHKWGAVSGEVITVDTARGR